MPAARNWRNGQTPCIFLLEMLAASGWSVGTPPDMHSAESIRRFSAKDPVDKKAYLRCLVGLDELMRLGLSQLPSSGLATYYQCVLASRDPAAVPLGKSGKFYEQLLKGKPIALAVHDIQPAVGSAPPIVCADDDMNPCVALVPMKKKQRTRAAATKQSQAESDSSWTQLVNIQVAPLPIAPPPPLQVVPAEQIDPAEQIVLAEHIAPSADSFPMAASAQAASF